jgi:ABC-type Fe3+-hydroxamate transport system substrate-binding protein
MQRSFTDMTGRKIGIPYPPKRIVSLVPSQTELLYDLGLDAEVVGITKFCVHPESWFRTKTRIGGTKTVHLDRVRALQPDLIIANKEENTREQVEALAMDFPVWISNIQTVDEGLQMILGIGDLTCTAAMAAELITAISKGFSQLPGSSLPRNVAYFIWKDPWMCAGGDTFINDIIFRMGWRNVLAGQMRYPEVSPQMLADAGVDLVLLSSEPYPFKEKHIAEISKILPAAKILLVDGEMFSWYGSRMLKAVSYLSDFLTRSEP